MADTIFGDINEGLGQLVSTVSTLATMKNAAAANARAIETQQRLEKAQQFKQFSDTIKIMQNVESTSELQAVEPMVTSNPILQNLFKAKSGKIQQDAANFNSLVTNTPIVTQPAPAPKPELRAIPQFTDNAQMTEFLTAQGLDVGKLQELEQTQGQEAVQKRVTARLKARGFQTEATNAAAAQTEIAAEPAVPGVSPSLQALRDFQTAQEGFVSRGNLSVAAKKGKQTATRTFSPPKPQAAFNQFLRSQQIAQGKDFSPEELYRVGVNQPFVPQDKLKAHTERAYNGIVQNKVSQALRGKKNVSAVERNMIREQAIRETSSEFSTSIGGNFVSDRYADLFGVPEKPTYLDGSQDMGKILLRNGFSTMQEAQRYRVENPMEYNMMLDDGMEQQGMNLLATDDTPRNYRINGQMVPGTTATAIGEDGVPRTMVIPMQALGGAALPKDTVVAGIQATKVDDLTTSAVQTMLFKQEKSLVDASRTLTDLENTIASIPPENLQAVVSGAGGLNLFLNRSLDTMQGLIQTLTPAQLKNFDAADAARKLESDPMFKRIRTELGPQAQTVVSKYNIALFEVAAGLAEQSGRALSDRDVKIMRDALGQTSVTSITAGINALQDLMATKIRTNHEAHKAKGLAPTFPNFNVGSRPANPQPAAGGDINDFLLGEF